MYDVTDPAENLRQTREVAALLRNSGMDGDDANTLAILGGLPGTDGGALRQAAQGAPPGQAPAFDDLRPLTIVGGGQAIAGSQLAVEEVFARTAAMGYDPSIPAVVFHCVEDGCHARAQLVIDRMQQLGLGPDQIRRVWAFSEKAFDSTAPKMRPTAEDGSLLLDYQGVVLEFDYHVAPAVVAEGPGGSSVLSVIDPSLLKHPVSVDGWHQRVGTPLQRHLAAQTTELGIPPVHPGTGLSFPGSGYRPWHDPYPLTVSQHAEAEMIRIMTADANLGRPARPLLLL